MPKKHVGDLHSKALTADIATVLFRRSDSAGRNRHWCQSGVVRTLLQQIDFHHLITRRLSRNSSFRSWRVLMSRFVSVRRSPTKAVLI